MRVFHGSYMAVSEIDLTKGRSNLDFGRGFYVTNNLHTKFVYVRLAHYR